MKKTCISAALAGTILLGGCASYGQGGYGQDGGGLGGGGILGAILGGGGSDYGYNARDDFERAAVDACGREASRYGRARIESVNQQERDYVYVQGRIETRDYNRDEFTCVFRSDGRVVDFQTR